MQLIVFLNLAISFHSEIESILFVCYYITPGEYSLSVRWSQLLVNLTVWYISKFSNIANKLGWSIKLLIIIDCLFYCIDIYYFQYFC